MLLYPARHSLKGASTVSAVATELMHAVVGLKSLSVFQRVYIHNRTALN